MDSADWFPPLFEGDHGSNHEAIAGLGSLKARSSTRKRF